MNNYSPQSKKNLPKNGSPSLRSPKSDRFLVGLTGGIASGKSTISQLFASLGTPIIDTDIISHQLMQQNQAAYIQTVKHFGQSILNNDGSINRPGLRKIIFNEPQQKSWLENMIHPLIRKKTQENILNANTEDYVLIIVPLMFETGFDQLVDHVIAIDCPAETQIKRLTQRDNIDKELAQKMIAAQMDNQSRLSRADSVLANPDNKNRHQEVLQLHQKLLKLAAS